MKLTNGSSRLSLIAGLALTLGASAIVFAQQNSTSSSGSNSVSGNGQSSGSAWGSASSGGSHSAGGSQGGQAGGGGFGMNVTKPTFAAWYEKTPQSKNEQANASTDRDHASYMNQLAKNQVLVLDGPFGDRSGFMAVIQCDDMDSALKIINADPAIRNGMLRATVKGWQMRVSNGVATGVRMPVPSNIRSGGGTVRTAGGG